MDEQTKQFIREEIQRAIQNRPVGIHLHNGLDSLRLTADLTWFRTDSVTTASTAPTDTPVNGTTRVQYDTTHWYLWVRVNNLWKGVALS